MRLRAVSFLLIIQVFLFLSTACNSLTSSRENVNIENEGDLKYSRKRGDVKLDVAFKPSKELKSKSVQEDSTQAHLDRFYYFIISLSVNGKDLETNAILNNTFSEKIQEFSSHMREYIKGMADNKDEIEIVDYIYPRMYGGTPSTSFMVSFDRAQLMNNNELSVVVSYPDIGILNESFKYKIKDLEDASGY